MKPSVSNRCKRDILERDKRKEEEEEETGDRRRRRRREVTF